MAVGVLACTKPEDLLQGTSVNVHNDLLVTPVTVQILTVDGDNLPKDIKVTAVGPDKDKIYTVFGEKELFVNYNTASPRTAILSLAIRRVTKVSVDEPLEFALKVEAEGYNPVFRNFRVEDMDNDMFNIRIAERGQAADGIFQAEGGFELSSQGANEAFSLVTPATSAGQRVRVEVAPGTQMMDASGRPVSGAVTAYAAQYDNNFPRVNEAAPVNFISNNAIGLDGSNLGPSAFSPIASYSLDMYGSDAEVKSFSQPIQVEVTIPAGTAHPETGAELQVGDEVPVWSYNESIGEWQEEQPAVVTSRAGNKLFAQVEQSHLSTWLLGGRVFCQPFTRIIVNNDNQPQQGPSRFYYVEVFRSDNGNVVGTFYTRFYDAQVITILAPQAVANTNITGGFRIFRTAGEALAGDDPIYVSPSFDPCGDLISIDLTDVLATGNSTRMFVDVGGTCTSNFNELVVRPTLPLLYRQSGETEWNPLGWLDAGLGSTSALEKGVTYDFRISYRSLERCVFDLEVPTDDETITVESTVYTYEPDTPGDPDEPFSEDVEVVYMDEDNDGTKETVRFIYTDILVPDQACQEYIDFLNSPFN